MPNSHATEPATSMPSPLQGSMLGAAQPTQANVQSRSRTSLILVGLAALVLATVFVATHMLPVPGGKIAVTSAITHGHLFDQRPSFSADEVLARVDGYGEAGRAAYQVMTFTTDLVFPLAILVLLVLTARHLLLIGRPALLTRAGASMAIGFFGSDMIENAMIYHLLGIFPQTSFAASMLGIVTIVKFALLAGAVVMLTVSAALRIRTGQ